MDKTSLYESFLQRAKETPSAIAVRDERRSLSYDELRLLADTIAARLPHCVRFVGIVMDHGAEMIAAMLAVLKLGAVYVPAEPGFPVERIRFMLTEADVDAVVTQRAYDDLFQSVTRVFVEPGMSLCEEPVQTPCVAEASRLAYVLYTSGTTGVPKGVCVEHRNVLSYIDAFTHEMGLTSQDVMLQYSVCSFDIFVEEVFATLLSGATLAIPSVHDRSNTERLIDYIARQKVTIVDGFPHLLADINRAAALPEGVRLYVSGGDVLRASYCDRLVGVAQVYNTYGPSETTCCASFYCVSDGAPLEDGSYPIGRAVRCDRIEILDDGLRPVGDGEVGEICIFGDGVSRGYLGDHPEQSNFVSLPDGRRLYRSGDLGYLLPDGNVAFLHRKDSQVMIEGRRVECLEVENVLIADTAIHQATVRAYRDERGLSYMVAYVVPSEAGLRLSELRARLGRRLADFMIPEFFVRMDEIPLTENGKPDGVALPVVLKG